MNTKTHKLILSMILGVLLTYIFTGCSNDVSEGKFVAMTTSAGIYYSEDGINWTQVENTGGYGLFSVCYGNGKFIVLGHSKAYSTDGNKWIPITLASGGWENLCYGNGKFVAIDNNGGNSKVAYSEDGITWSVENFPNGSWASICYGNGKFVAIGNDISSNSIAVYSTNGSTWSVPYDLPDDEQWSSVCYGKGRFVAVAINYGYTAYSTDGKTWTKTTELLPNSIINLNSVCYGNGKFVAVNYTGYGENNKNVYSTDGITWKLTNLKGDQWNSVCYGNGKFVAVGLLDSKYNIAYSTDGITWNYASFTIPSTLPGIPDPLVGLQNITYGLDSDIFGFL